MSMEDISQAPQATSDPSSSSSPIERRPSGDEDPAAMTIEFLRARLLSERSVSKAARQRAQLLAKKVSELEERLETEIQHRKKLEADRLEILSKYRAELSVEYGEFFASSFGEGFSRNESVPESPNTTKHDTNEGFLAYTPNEDEEGLSISRTEQLDRSDSSQQFNREEMNDDDDEFDHSGREKGVLSWGRRKGSRKEVGHGTDWLGRSLSQRSLTSADGESPHKRWAGKSVRQIRKRESRHYDTNFEGEPGQTQASEDFDGKSGQPDDMKEPLQCEDERDTEVERVLERQAEFIEQFEAEEIAQRAWEAKFKEAKALANYESAKVINQSNSGSNLETMTGSQFVKNKSLAEDDATKVVVAESTLPTQSVNEGTTKYSRKVHPEDCPSKMEGEQAGPAQAEIFQTMASDDSSGTEIEKGRIVLNATVENEASLTNTQGKIGSTASGENISEEEQSGVDERTEVLKSSDERLTDMESSRRVLKKDSSQDQAFSNADIEQRLEHSTETVMEHGKSNKYRKHLSSSFRFTVFADAEPVTSSSPQMPGFATYKQDTDKIDQYREVGKEQAHLNGPTAAHDKQVAGFGLSDGRHEDPHYHGAATASRDRQISADNPLPSGDCPVSREDTESEEKSKDILHAVALRREQLPPHLITENDAMDYLPNHDPDPASKLISDSIREEVLKRMSRTLGAGQDLQPRLGRHYSDFPSHPESRGLGGGMDLPPGQGRHYSDFPSHPEFSMQQLQIASKDMEGANFDNFASLPGNRSGMPSTISHANAYEETAFRSHRRSVDGGFDRVSDVLRALQIAKHQVQSSNEEAIPFTGGTTYRNGYDDGDAFYVEPPHIPPVYAAPRQYPTSVPYSSRGPIPFTQNAQGWGGVAAGYGVGSSRQLANAPYIPYASRMPEPRNLWPPPSSHGVHNSNMYHYDTRQHR